MNTVDARPQAFQGQRRQQRHPDDDSTNGFLPVSSGNFLLPDQSNFTFSAEPTSMIDYASMNLPLATTGQDSAFTPNTASSFDSSLHPELMNQSYPPPYMQAPSYGLSPATHSRNGQSISPSHSVDHLSPEASYMSDPSYQDHLSNYTTPSYNGQYLNESFSALNFSDNNMSAQVYNQQQAGMNMSMPMTADTLATFNAQPPMLPSNARLDSHSHLLSPCPTNNSSPNIAEEASRNAGFAAPQYTGNDYTSSTPPDQIRPPHYSTPKRQQQHSPALTNSPGNMAIANPQPQASHLTSPIVRIEQHFSRGESPTRSDISRPVSKRSHGSRRSGNHLSPFAHEDSSEDDDVASHDQVRARPVVRATERNEDGSWRNHGSGQAGLGPEDRLAMGDVLMPTLEELEEHRKREEKKLEVHDWLTKSEVGSEAGDVNPSSNLLAPFPVGRRRAKSTNDVHRNGMVGGFNGLGVDTSFNRFDDSNIPGPGVWIDERSEYEDYDDDEDMEPESPPAEVDLHDSHRDDSDSYFPPVPIADHAPLNTTLIRPWTDVVPASSSSTTRYQPPTSNAAMSRFYRRAKDVESASLAATVGSRRLSESDLGSIRGVAGVIKVIEPDPKKSKERQRRPSFLENILPKRTPTNLLKRKGSIPVQPAEAGAEKAKELVHPEKPKRIGSWGRPKSPRLDTSVAMHGNVGPSSSTGLSASPGPWYQSAKSAIKRTRSRSDLGKSPGLKELMTQHGGPPMPMLASPLADTEATKPSPQPSPGGDDDDDDGQEAVMMDLKVRSDPIIPTYEGFKTHARQLNPRLVDYMVERITQEQQRRYKRLLEFRVKHLNAVKNRNCSSNKFCIELGGESKQLPPRAGNKDSEAPFIGFQITAPGSSDDDGEPPPEGTVVSAQFPSGVPLPPVKRLPAEFECPLCFKVKKFYKPSDWTKHVHEDVQPFTCTFPNCGEPKSFKRKADWVRHENERHRQLENWTCQIADCNHTCYRKDNFVQHLVREHKIAEPRARAARGANKDVTNKKADDNIWNLVERCRRDTTKQPKDEPCRFCGNICNSWKKLTVHLAKHMEQISMPILPLVEQKQMNADTIISPVVELPESRKLSITPNKSPIDNPSRYNPNSTLAPGIDPSFGQFPQDSSASVASNAMHTYPPPQMVPFKGQPVPQNNFAQPYSGSTYPGLQDAAKISRGAYLNGINIPNQSYQNGNMQNAPNRFPITPVSAIGQQQQQQQQQPVFTTSPVDTTPFSTDTLGSTYFSQEPQNLAANGVADMGFDTSNGGIHFQPAPVYQDMSSYMPTQQHNNYQFHGQ
ncbi:hypothetical protein BS50DRAFT_563489 [Corynespora cassiicola Philippines]|uniref:C2H2-type domain-containing protein n=1 Tax=Corynespora cassiicola Philippines TaxID=1448308 RepID=A0A2T2N5Y7_CORCC|nr:hypothetical protein BS50DRAFT_563489 [Corynespora cassiicola Philippines]